MTTDTDLANHALAELGEPDIVSIDGTDSVSKRCKRFVDQVKKEVLRRHRWNCATKRVVLSELASAPAHGLDHQFQLPSDFLRLLEVNGEEWEASSEYFEIENGNVLVTDEDECKIRYIAEIGVADMDALLKEAVALKLAAKLAMGLKGRTEARDALKVAYRLVIAQATRVDAVESKSREGRGIARILGNSPLVRSRYLGRYSQTAFYNRFPTWSG